MKKQMTLLAIAVIMLLTLTACGGTAAGESNPPQNDSNLTDQEQTDTSDTLRLLRADEAFGWLADLIDEWEKTLGVTIDEIFDNVRAQSRLDYAFEYNFEGIDVSEWAAAVGNTPVEFMSTVQTAYFFTRSIDVVHKWAAELGMTALELVDYVFSGNDSEHLSDKLGVELSEFQTVLAGVSNALRQERVRAYSNAESVDTVRKWATELGMTLDEFIESYNDINFDFAFTTEALGVEPLELSHTLQGVIDFLNSP